MILTSSRNRIPPWLPGLLLAFLMLNSVGCATSRPLPEVQLREHVIETPATFTQRLPVPVLQGQSNEDLERQRNECLAQLQEANGALDRIRRWSDTEAAKSASPSSPSSFPVGRSPTLEQLKVNLKHYLERKGEP